MHQIVNNGKNGDSNFDSMFIYGFNQADLMLMRYLYKNSMSVKTLLVVIITNQHYEKIKQNLN